MGKLVDRLRAEIADEHQSQINELLSNDVDGNQPSRNGFSAAVAKSNAQALADLERDAIDYLKRSGDSLKNPAALQAFRSRFGGLGGLGASRLDEIINRHCEP